MTIGERIKQIRGKVSQKEFAISIGVAQNTLGNYERGDRTPNADVIVRIAKDYDVSFNWLLLGEGARQSGTNELGKSNQCKQCQELETELAVERKLVRDLMNDNRELVKENRDLNKELRLAVKESSYFKAKAGAAELHMRERPAEYGQADEDSEARPP